MKLPRIDSAAELCSLVEEIGFLPFLDMSGKLSGYSLMDITQHLPWWSEDPALDPWQWRVQLSNGHKIVYGRLFGKKTGFVSLHCYPYFVNYRRNGYDFDSLCDEGLATYKAKCIMGAFERSGKTELASNLLKTKSGFDKTSGMKGFSGALTSLEMQTYLTISGFRKRMRTDGVEFGWDVAQYATPETIWGKELICSAYGEAPGRSFERLAEKAIAIESGLSEQALLALLK